MLFDPSVELLLVVVSCTGHSMSFRSTTINKHNTTLFHTPKTSRLPLSQKHEHTMYFTSLPTCSNVTLLRSSFKTSLTNPELPIDQRSV
uniref:Putative secreted protein n=1 Tax=Anopheles darlingi TaxID=43151 RepID=A0A2M4DJV8_ANODA